MKPSLQVFSNQFSQVYFEVSYFDSPIAQTVFSACFWQSFTFHNLSYFIVGKSSSCFLLIDGDFESKLNFACLYLKRSSCGDCRSSFEASFWLSSGSKGSQLIKLISCLGFRFLSL